MTPVHVWLRELRRKLGLNQHDVEQGTAAFGEAARVTQSYLSRLERGSKPLSALTPPKMNALRVLYRVSPDEWTAHTGLAIITPPDTDEATGGLEFIRMPVHALASAGVPISDDNDATVLGSIVDTELVPREEFRGGMIVLEVQGDSMTREGGGIRHGDRIYVDSTDLELREGKIFVLHVHGGGTVVKRVRRFDHDFWLTSDNPNYPPLKPDQATVIGRVYYHQPRGHRL